MSKLLGQISASHRIKRFFLCPLFVLIPTALCFCTGLMSTKIADIRNKPRDYVGKEVVVHGTVTTTHSLLLFKYFTLQDDTGEITIVTQRPLPKKGERLKVRGTVREAFSLGTESLLVIEEEPEREK